MVLEEGGVGGVAYHSFFVRRAIFLVDVGVGVALQCFSFLSGRIFYKSGAVGRTAFR